MADGFAPLASVAAEAAFLGVERSLSGRRWRERAHDRALVRAHQLAHGLEEPLARALAARGVGEREAGDFLQPTLRALFPDPSSFRDMDRAAELLVDAAMTGRPCAVLADYDVDGATSAALLVRWFRAAAGRELCIYVPDRMTEGYGPSPAAFRRLKAQGIELVVTVDCGAAAVDALEAAAELGLQVVVIDHHLMRPGERPRAAALVNPNQPGCNSGQGVLAAAGVALVLLAALNREGRRRGLFGPTRRREPDPRAWLDLAALGAVCDVTALTGFNRALTTLGLKVMGGWANPGLKALLAAAGVAEGSASAFHAGFVLGPRINAGGRIGRSDLGVRLLSTDDPAEAADLAAELDALNTTRREVEAQTFEEAVRRVEAGGAGDAAADPVLTVAGEGWHPGVVGIVASRLRERYRRPAVVIGLDPAADVGKGSGRSQAGVNLGAAVQAAYAEGLLMAGGGHAMAAGLTVRPARVAELRGFLNGALAGEREAADDAFDIDALVTTAVGRELHDRFQGLAPFGPGNPEPAFACAHVAVERPMAVRGGHLRCTLMDDSGRRLRAVAWRAADTALGRRLLEGGSGLHVAGRLRPDDWMGRDGVQLEIEDVADPRQVG